MRARSFQAQSQEKVIGYIDKVIYLDVIDIGILSNELKVIHSLF